MFRKEIKERILGTLKDSRLTEHAFQVQFGSQSSEDLVQIRYVLRDSFRFRAFQTEDGFSVLRAPGEQLLTEESFGASNAERVIQQLQYWLHAVEVEDEINPEIDSDVAKLKEAFFRDLSRHVKDENRHFTKEEADELISRIEKLEQQIETIMAGQNKSANEISAVKKQMRAAKQDASTMTKRKWLVVGGGKIFNALISIATSKEGRKAIVDSIRGYLEQKTS
jgi:uncharacterized protein YdcH (DUF465 family)